MPNDKLDALGNTQATRRTVLKGLLVGLGAGVLVQAAGGVTASARSEQEKPGGDQKTGKNKVEKAKEGEGGKKLEKGKSDSKSKNEKKKVEEPKNQRKK